MYWETVPNWFLIIYYLFLLVTLGTATFNIIRKQMTSLSILAVSFTLTVPLVFLINSIGREEGLNELEYLVNQLQQGSIWSIYTTMGLLYLLVWWVLFFRRKVK